MMLDTLWRRPRRSDGSAGPWPARRALCALVTIWTSCLVGSPVASAQSTDAEFRCQAKVGRAGEKFFWHRAKCVVACIEHAQQGTRPVSDCYYPYGGATAACIGDVASSESRGADNRFRDDIRKACDPSFRATAACPACYTGGDCGTTGQAVDWVLNQAGFFDSFDTGIYCEPMPGASDAEIRCETSTAKALWKLMGRIGKCYDRCYALARRGTISPSACAPFPEDAATTACIVAADAAAVAQIDERCDDLGAAPDACGSPYPSGASWANLFDVAYGGFVEPIYCAP